MVRDKKTVRSGGRRLGRGGSDLEPTAVLRWQSKSVVLSGKEGTIRKNHVQLLTQKTEPGLKKETAVCEKRCKGQNPVAFSERGTYCKSGGGQLCSDVETLTRGGKSKFF